MRLLVANRGEVAVRLLRAAADRGIPAVAVVAADEPDAPHAAPAAQVVRLDADGPAAYADVAALVDAAVATGCTHLHPGYGFASEDPALARRCAAAGVTFVGPSAEVLATFADKVRAREAAAAVGVPVLAATAADASEADVLALLRRFPEGVMIKATTGGGGRGQRLAASPEQVAAGYRRCRAEALAASGRDSVFAERLLTGARHVEVQVVGVPEGDGARVVAVGDRDCSVQRARQKLIEVAPARGLDDALRRRLHADAVRLAASAGLVGLATVEFLVRGEEYAFLEVNPRLQVEHTVTEEVTGLDLVGLSLQVAAGDAAVAARLPGVHACGGEPAQGSLAPQAGIAIQCRLHAERLGPDGRPVPSVGRLSAFVPPAGRGVRVDTHARAGLEVTGRYDPLLAKIVTHVPAASFPTAADKAARALAETQVRGLATNAALLAAVLADAEFRAGPVDTGWLERRLASLLPAAAGQEVTHGTVSAELAGTVVQLAAVGTVVPAGGDLAVLEALKMHHPLSAPEPVTVTAVHAEVGATVAPGDPLLTVAPAGTTAPGPSGPAPEAGPRGDLAAVRERHRRLGDEARADRLARIRARGRRTARENLADLVDAGSFVEYGPLAVAAQRARRSLDELVDATPGDGIIGGTATVAGAPVAVLSYDYSVLAGTQGMVGHDKTDRLLAVARRGRLPVVLFAEGGGGRPGDTDRLTTGLVVTTFRALAELRGAVPLVAVTSGRCFAGNAALAGTCDVIIATPDVNLGMGGPAMIEGGGLGRVAPEDIGPADVQVANGVIDVLAPDEAAAVADARRFLGFFTGPRAEFTDPDPELARAAVPASRLRAYDVRRALASVVDPDSVLELRPRYGRGIVTALARVAGRPLAILANDSRHLGGAIDAVAARKAVEFLRLAGDFGLPVLSLVDTPGFMVGPAAEREGGVRAFPALFAAGAALRVPTGAIILRKGYGLGAMAMTMGHLRAPLFTVAWPTAELGPMGLEGAVMLAARRELEAEADPAARQALFDKLVAVAYEHGAALNAAGLGELDDVIDPADSRAWIQRLWFADR